jgi:hypothetical protein
MCQFISKKDRIALKNIVSFLSKYLDFSTRYKGNRPHLKVAFFSTTWLFTSLKIKVRENSKQTREKN